MRSRPAYWRECSKALLNELRRESATAENTNRTAVPGYHVEVVAVVLPVVEFMLSRRAAMVSTSVVSFLEKTSVGSRVPGRRVREVRALARRRIMAIRGHLARCQVKSGREGLMDLFELTRKMDKTRDNRRVRWWRYTSDGAAATFKRFTAPTRRSLSCLETLC